ncbi:Sigma-54 dependent DNA-binding response regulator [Nitrospira sp. KM1]|nr:Sigma-54 dependent DNA-binding response regulator [Nitrospira sp. KM1]
MQALQDGANDYLAKPFTVEALRPVLARFERRTASHSGDRSHQEEGFDRLISLSPQMQLLKRLALEVAATDATVLITGESGTGKELFAKAIHLGSARSRGPFVALNCGGIPEHLIESELFGYQRGAFTDAKHAKQGRFQSAAGGTLFLDEIGEMSPSAQAKLLRVLETHEVDPLGDTRSVPVNIRVVAATNEDLPAQIKAGRFRLDLYYRLNVYQLRIPSLRERPEDLEPIFHAFLESSRQAHGHRIRGITQAALMRLQRHDWPGNVRELHNVVEGLTITCKQEMVTVDDLPSSFRDPAEPSPRSSHGELSLLAFGLSLQEMEKKILEEALYKAAGNVTEASRLLKMTRNTLRYRMAKHHLT